VDRLSAEERRVIAAMAEGSLLRSHRNMDGGKSFLLHSSQGDATPVTAAVVRRLSARGLIGDNKKFPVATYWLTGRADRLPTPEG
jgi:hypothetical protein